MRLNLATADWGDFAAGEGADHPGSAPEFAHEPHIGQGRRAIFVHGRARRLRLRVSFATIRLTVFCPPTPPQQKCE